MNKFYEFLVKIIATVFFIGYIPIAPGTFGTLAALIFVWVLNPGIYMQMIILLLGLITGVVSAHIAERIFDKKDCGYIVIDEFVGYLVSVIFLPLTAGFLIAAFFLFRFFDILKPPPIRNAERIFAGGMGVMLDDVLAGTAANVILQAAAYVSKIVF